MCDRCDIESDPLLQLNAAAGMLDELLGGVVEPVTKAIELSTGKGFDRAVALLAARLRKAAGPADAAAVRDALRHLDIDWAGASRSERSRAVNLAIVAAGKATAIIPAQIRAPFGDVVDDMVRATRQDARRQGISIAADFNALDRRIIIHLTNSQGNFVRDEYGRRSEAFGAQARAIVASSLEQGLGRDDIAEELDRAARATFVNRSASYWTVIASAFVGNARSYAQMSSYAEAGIERYRIMAVLDEVTTPQCRFLDGKEFSVGSALDRFEQIENAEEPETIKQLAPWIREGTDEQSGKRVLWIGSGDARTSIAEVSRSGVGARDDRGEFRSLVSDKDLDTLGIGFPPYHGRCRTTTVSVV